MKNILGNTNDLELFNEEGKKVYMFKTTINGYSYEITYDKNGNELTYKNSYGHNYEITYDKNGNELTFKDSAGHSYEYTYDEQGDELTYKNANGDCMIKGKFVTKEEFESFVNGTPEYTMEELVSKLGHNFKIKK